MRWLVGLLPLIASTLKAYQLMFDPSVLASSTVDHSLLFLLVALEYGLAILVLSGFYWQQLRWVVLVLFIGFAAYSLFLAVSGAASCGCFGSVKVSPWWTFLIDTAIVFGLLSSVRNRIQNTTNVGVAFPTKNRLLVGRAFFLVPVIALSASVFVNHGRTSAGPISQVGNLTILEPENWIGQELPIAPFIDVDLSHGRLMSKREWFVQTPVELILENGIVVAASNHHE